MRYAVNSTTVLGTLINPSPHDFGFTLVVPGIILGRGTWDYKSNPLPCHLTREY